MNASSSVIHASVMGLQLDELELASLRGEVQEVSFSVNFDTRMGRAKVNVAGPRFSGLQGDMLSGGVRWERDVIRLEKAVLQQTGSRSGSSHCNSPACMCHAALNRWLAQTCFNSA